MDRPNFQDKLKIEELSQQIQILQLEKERLEQSKGSQEGYIQLYRKYEVAMNKLNSMEMEKQQLAEQVEILASRLAENNYYSQELSYSNEPDLVNRLNARITQLKLREEKLLEENARLEERLGGDYSRDDEFKKREQRILEQTKRDVEIKLQNALQTNKSLQTKLDYYAKEEAAQQKQYEQIEEENERLNNEIKKLKSQVDKSKSIQLDLESQVFALEQTLKSAYNVQEVKDQAKIRWEREIELIRKEQQTENERYNKEVHELKQIIELLKKENQEYKQLNQQMTMSYENLKQKLVDVSEHNNQLLKINTQNTEEIRETKMNIVALKDKTEIELKRRDNMENQLRDKISILQDQINNIMKEKHISQAELQNEINRLCHQQASNLEQLEQDNRNLENRCIQVQEEFNQQRMQFQMREDQLLNEIRIMQDKVNDVIKKKLQKKQNQSRSQSGARERPQKLMNESKTASGHLNNNELIREQKSSIELLEQERARANDATVRVRQLEQMLLDQKKQTLYQQQSQVQQLYQPSDLRSELSDLRTSLTSLKAEKEKVFQQIKNKDDQLNLVNRQNSDLQDQIAKLEFQLKQQDELTKEASGKYNKNIDHYQNEMQKLKYELSMKDEQLQKYQNDAKVYANERCEMNEQIIRQREDINDFKVNIEDQESKFKNQIKDLQNKNQMVLDDLVQLQPTLLLLRQELDSQTEIYDETIKRQQNLIEILKERFANDLQELQTKQNIYFNQNHVIKQSLVPSKEQVYLNQLIQQYCENTLSIANNQAKLKMAQEKNKIIKQKNVQYQNQVKELQNEIEQLKTEKEILAKKVEKFRPKFGKKKDLQQESFNIVKVVEIKLQQGQISELQMEIVQLKSKLQLFAVQIDQLTQVNRGLEVDLRITQNQTLQLHDTIKEKEQLLGEITKQHKQEIAKTIDQLQSVQQKYIPEEKVQSLQEQLKERDQQIKELQFEVSRRKDVGNQFRQDKEDIKGTIDQLKKEKEQMQEELEKLRVKQKDGQRKDQNVREFREKVEQMKAKEQSIQEENKQVNEKLRLLKNEVLRKDQMIKELRDKLEGCQFNSSNQGEIKQMSEQIKKLKDELNRKDGTIKHFKQKLEEKTNEIENTKSDNAQRYSQSIQELEREMRKNDQLKITSKKFQNQISTLLHLLKRIYRDNYLQIMRNKTNRSNVNTTIQSKLNMSKFSESMNILNIQPEDLEDFLEPQQQQQASKSEGVRQEQIDQFEQECSNIEQLDVNKIYQMMNTMIQERVEQGIK